MRPIAILILILTIAIGTYLNRFDTERDSQVMIEDSVGSTMAAPIQQ